MVLDVTRPEGNLANAKPLDLVAIGQSSVLPGRELVIERGDLVQPIDDLFIDHRSGIAPSPFRFPPEEPRVGRNRGVRQCLIHIVLTPGLHGAIQPFPKAVA